MSASFKVRFYSPFMRLISVYLERNGNGQDTFQSVIQKGLGLFSSAECGLFGLCTQSQPGCAGNTTVDSPWSICLQLDLPLG